MAHYPTSPHDARDSFPVEHRKRPTIILATVLLALIAAAVAWFIG